MRASLSTVAISLLLAWSGPASADPATTTGPRVAMSPGAAVAWRAPAGCPDAASLRARVEHRLERSLDGVSLGVEVDVTRTGGRYLARVDLRAITVANDVRTLTSKRCSELADAVAVIVARIAGEVIARRVATAASAAVSIASTDPIDPSDTIDEADRIIVDARHAPQPARPPRRWTIGARVSGVSGIGVIPKVGLGGELAVTLRYDRRLAELAHARWVVSAAQFHSGGPAKVDVDLDVAIARYGWRPHDLPLRAWLGVEVGTMHGRGVKLPGQQLESGRWLSAGAGFAVTWQMLPWARVVGAMEVMAAVERIRFTLGDGMVAYAPAPMSVRTTCGLEVGWQ
jgi:hypothetical protein